MKVTRYGRTIRAELTVSSKRQITLPAAMTRQLGLDSGDKLTARLEDGRIVMRPQPKDWLAYVTGGPGGLYGRTKEEVDAYIREVREGWDERAKIAEGDAYIPEDAEDYAERIQRMRKDLPRVADGP